MSNLFGGSGDATGATPEYGMATGEPSPASPSSGKLSWPSWLTTDNASNALKIVSQLRAMEQANKAAPPGAAAAPQFVRGTPAAPMATITAKPVSGGTVGAGGGGGGNNQMLLKLLSMLMSGRR